MENSPEPGEESIVYQLCESCRQKELKEKIQQITTENELKIDQLTKEIEIKKEALRELLKCRQLLGRIWDDVVMTRSKVKLMRRTYENEKASRQLELEELGTLQKSNSRREERLARVRTKNLCKKEIAAVQEFADSRKMAASQLVELEKCRRQLVMQVLRGVLPIEVEPLSEADAGEEDYEASVLIDCDSVLEVDDGWVLSGVHKHSQPNMCIVNASMPANGNYATFLKTVSERRKARQEAAQQGVPPLTPDNDCLVHPLKDPYLSIPAGLVFTALFTDVIATTLDQPLPHPISRRIAIGEYGNPGRRKKDFLNSVAKLDDNILFLCFAQNVPLSALTPGHTLQNLLALVTHTQFGRTGAFECYPEMMRYRGCSRAPSTLSYDIEDSEPPAVLYTAVQSKQLESELSESSSDSEDNLDSRECEEFEEMYDWEYLEPSIRELRMFEEEQIKAKLVERTGKMGAQKTVASEVEAHRDRLRRLDYDSSYLDYTAALSSTKSSASSEASKPTTGSNETADNTRGFFGTLSSLWSSAFGPSS